MRGACGAVPESTALMMKLAPPPALNDSSDGLPHLIPSSMFQSALMSFSDDFGVKSYDHCPPKGVLGLQPVVAGFPGQRAVSAHRASTAAPSFCRGFTYWCHPG